ncbi:CLOCK-interacting pacemaker [Diretmus argenteus]
MSTKRKAEGHSGATSKLRAMKSAHSRADSERDSGFSDGGSEHMSTMDSQDSPQGLQRSGSGPSPSQLSVVGGSYSNISPMIIMNNVLLKQPGDNPPALKPWGFRPAVEVVQPVVFLQPVVSSASKEASSKHQRPKKYLPILKSYPKIAPHPGDSSSSSGRGTASSSSSSSSSSGSERGGSLASSHRERYQKDKRQRSRSGGPSNSGRTTPSLPAPPSPMSPLLQQRLALPSTETNASATPASDRPSPAVSQAEFSPAPSPSPSLTPSNHTGTSKNQTLSVSQPQESGCLGELNYADSDPDSKRKRFCNTYNILSKSGLLDITLRTKELLRQNRRTQSDLDRLKEHTQLFLQALQGGDRGAWAELQARLQEEDWEEERGAQSTLDLD